MVFAEILLDVERGRRVFRAGPDHGPVLLDDERPDLLNVAAYELASATCRKGAGQQ